MELYLIFAPILKGQQNLIFNAQNGRSARLFLGSFKFFADKSADMAKCIRLDSAMSLELLRRQMFCIFIAHYFFLSYYLAIVKYHL